MVKNRFRTHKKSSNDVIGGQWLPNLLTWGGVLLMLTGGIIAYPVLQNYLAPPDTQGLEFSVTLAPSPAVIALPPIDTVTAPPLLILPETELVIIPESATARPAETEAPPEPTPVPYFWRDQLSGKQEPTPTSTPTPTSALPTAIATATPDPVGA